jgi:hypothetical protein
LACIKEHDSLYPLAGEFAAATVKRLLAGSAVDPILTRHANSDAVAIIDGEQL